jgi:hypothetical protein
MTDEETKFKLIHIANKNWWHKIILSVTLAFLLTAIIHSYTTNNAELYFGILFKLYLILSLSTIFSIFINFALLLVNLSRREKNKSLSTFGLLAFSIICWVAGTLIDFSIGLLR